MTPSSFLPRTLGSTWYLQSAKLATQALSTVPSNNGTQTPGQALFVLQKKGADYGRLGRSEVKSLFESARGGKPTDAHVIRTALKEFKRNCEFILDNRQAHPAIEGMIRAMTPLRAPEEYPMPDSVSMNMSVEQWLEKRRVIQARREYEAAIFAAEAIVDEKTGLRTSTYTVKVNQVLSMLLNAINIVKDKDPMIEIDRIYAAMNASEGLVRMLRSRAQHPEKRMNKKAARRFLKSVKTTEGPDEETKRLISTLRIDLKEMLDASKRVVATDDEDSDQNIDEASANRNDEASEK